MVLARFGFYEVEDDGGRGKQVAGEARAQGGSDLERGLVLAVAVGAFEVVVRDVGVGLGREVPQPVEARGPKRATRKRYNDWGAATRYLWPRSRPVSARR